MNKENPFVKLDLTFTRNFDIISNLTQLSPIEKNIINLIVSYQIADKVCTESNPTLATRFGVSLDKIRRAITNLNKLGWFSSGKEIENNRKKMTVNETELLAWIKSSSSDLVKSNVSPIETSLIEEELSATEPQEDESSINEEGEESFERLMEHLKSLKNAGVPAATLNDFKEAIKIKEITTRKQMEAICEYLKVGLYQEKLVNHENHI